MALANPVAIPFISGQGPNRLMKLVQAVDPKDLFILIFGRYAFTTVIHPGMDNKWFRDPGGPGNGGIRKASWVRAGFDGIDSPGFAEGKEVGKGESLNT